MAVKELMQLARNIHSMQQFANACKGLHSDHIYILFEDEITQDLRDEITQTFWSVSQEPVRSALRQLGERYDVRELQEY